MEIEKKTIEEVDNKLIKRYSDRLIQFGVEPRTLGWDNKTNQHVRFSTAYQTMDFREKSILDIGCGFADFYEFLRSNIKINLPMYTGIDINPDLINICTAKYPECTFMKTNILLEPLIGEQWDIVTMFGLLNFRFTEFDNITYAKKMIEKAFSLCRHALVVDMLSIYSEPSYPKEDFVFYYDPTEMIKFAFELTPYVTVKHDYPAIPQREFMLFLRREPC